MFPSLQILDSHNRYGELVFSDDENQGAEGGEDEYSENEPVALDEEMMEELRMRGISVKDYMKSFAGEGGEDDQSDEYQSEDGDGAHAHENKN